LSADGVGDTVADENRSGANGDADGFLHRHSDRPRLGNSSEAVVVSMDA
jgi:hypothetical protein